MEEKYYVYVLYSLKEKILHIGYTTHLESRLDKHRRGKIKYTRVSRPLKLIYYEVYISKDDARRRKRYFRSPSGKETLRYLLKGTREILKMKYR
jgi:putative endonuclease